MSTSYSNNELNNVMSLAANERNVISTNQAQKNSDFVNKDTPPYGILAGLGIVGGATAVIVSNVCKSWDKQLKKSIKGVGIALLVIGSIMSIVAVIMEVRKNKVKDAIAENTVKALDDQTENNLHVSGAYAAAIAGEANDQIKQLDKIAIASSKADLSSKLSRDSASTGVTAKMLSSDEIGEGLNNLSSLHNHSLSSVQGFLRS